LRFTSGAGWSVVCVRALPLSGPPAGRATEAHQR
jgi:hypothetical protein